MSMPAILAYSKCLKTIGFWNGFKKCLKSDSYQAVAGLVVDLVIGLVIGLVIVLKRQDENILTLLLIVRLNAALTP